MLFRVDERSVNVRSGETMSGLSSRSAQAVISEDMLDIALAMRNGSSFALRIMSVIGPCHVTSKLFIADMSGALAY